MSGFEVRGYMISTTAEYLQQAAKKRNLKDVLEQASPQLRQTLAEVKHAGWYPVSIVSELNRIIVARLGEDNEDLARKELQDCGRFMAHEATNTFLRLLMRMLTPTLFAKKLPDLWKRDCNSGRLDVNVDAEKKTLTCRLMQMDGYDHLAAVIPGYVSFAMEAMGKPVTSAVVDGWSINQPNANGATLTVTWD